MGLLIVLFVTLACVTPTATNAPIATLTEPGAIPTATGTPPAAPTTTPSPSLTPTLPPVVGPDPSARVAVFYYPWYRTPEVDGYWDHWGETHFAPPLDIASDFYPALGAYSIADPAVLAQHFAWLREAGVGVIISSWWGQRSREDRAVPLLLDVAEQYGIQVAFHIEPYGGRTAERLVDDVRYLYVQYGDHPAFCRSTASSRWSPDTRSKGLFFVWAIVVPDTESPEVGPGYWQEAVDDIHALPDGGLVIANATEGYWVEAGHFDGLYNYATLHLDKSDGFSWARAIPPDAWYTPSVMPGFSARRIGYPPEDHVDRQGEATYEEQWTAALDAGVEPAMVTITSFNEWHEGTQIEPAAVGATNGRGYTYDDYSPLPPDAYLTLTRQLADRFLATTWPETYRARIRLVTTSDWTTFGLVDGATWQRPSLVSASGEATYAWFEGDDLALIQPVARAETGESVEMVVDILLADCESDGTLVFEIERGHIGSTQVELANYLGTEPVVVDTFVWDGLNPGERNTTIVQILASKLMTPVL
jgi:glycoprotein endo-alpha-1,2-mannosidase